MWTIIKTSEQMQLSYMTRTGLKCPLNYFSVHIRVSSTFLEIFYNGSIRINGRIILITDMKTLIMRNFAESSNQIVS